MNFLGREIGKGKPVLTIAEAGINHNGDFSKALEMVDVAKRCGADIVKFQMRNLEALYRKKCLENPSDESHSLGVYIPILKDCELSKEQHRQLMEKCKAVGIKYLCSPWDIESVEVLEDLGVEGYKLPSACFSDTFLVRRLAKTGKPVIFSTGMHTDDELQTLLISYTQLFVNRMAVLHCVSSYPTADRDVNLNYMKWLGDHLPCPVGYSGHERGVPISVAAVALGATIIERHFTLDRTLPGPDHAASLDPHGMETLVRHIRAVEQALGDEKRINRGEVMARETLGKILTWAKDMEEGELITKECLKAMSPGYGIAAYKAEEYIGSFVATKKTGAGEPVLAHEILHKNQFKEGAKI